MSLVTSGGPCLLRNLGVQYNYMPLKNDSSCKKITDSTAFWEWSGVSPSVPAHLEHVFVFVLLFQVDIMTLSIL